MLLQSRLHDKLQHVVSEPATIAEVERAHTPAFVAHLRALSALPGRQQIDQDTVSGPTSFEAALVSAGGTIAAAQAVARGDASSALVLARPPGHHALAEQAMGFCLLNNVAIAARALLAGGAERVAIVDWDVHHGNGTQAIFEDDPSVLYISLHQFPFYPGTGAASEVGHGPGAGMTLNVPMSEGQDDAVYVAAFEQLVLPKLTAFAPCQILISAGFDAHADDPIGQMSLSGDAFGAMTASLCDWLARARLPGPVLVLEGGYSLLGLAESARACLQILLGDTAPVIVPRALPLFDELRALHRLTSRV